MLLLLLPWFCAPKNNGSFELLFHFKDYHYLMSAASLVCLTFSHKVILTGPACSINRSLNQALPTNPAAKGKFR
jgi:hypothetical protein